jgi:hypothetical protein
MLRLPIILICTFFQLTVFGQLEPFLLLEKPGKQGSRVRYYVGDEIHWRFFEDKTKNSAIIGAINDTSFVTTESLTVPFGEIESVLISKGGGLKAVGLRSFYAIPPMIVFSAANNLFNTGRTPVVDEEVWYISAVFAAISGVFFIIPDDKKNKLENKWRLIPVIH